MKFGVSVAGTGEMHDHEDENNHEERLHQPRELHLGVDQIMLNRLALDDCVGCEVVVIPLDIIRIKSKGYHRGR